METKIRLFLFAVRFDDEDGHRYGLPFPGTVETMKRDIRHSLKGFEEKITESYVVEALCDYVPTESNPIVISGMYPEFNVSDILAEVSDEQS